MNDNLTSRIQEIMESEARARSAQEDADILASERIYAMINIENGFQNGFDLIWRVEHNNISLNWLFHIGAATLVFKKFNAHNDRMIERATDLADLSVAARAALENFLSRPNLSQIVNGAVVKCLDEMTERIHTNRQLWADNLWPWATSEEATNDER